MTADESGARGAQDARGLVENDPLYELVRGRGGSVVLISAPDGLPDDGRALREGVEFLGRRLGKQLEVRDWRNDVG